MKKLAILLLGTNCSLWASAVLSTATVNTAIRVPATTFSGSPNFRIQARIRHARGPVRSPNGQTWANASSPIFQVGGYGIQPFNGAMFFQMPDANVEGSGTCAVSLNGAPDLIVGITRDLTSTTFYPYGQVRFELFVTATGASLGSCTYTVTAGGAASGTTIVNNGISVGNVSATGYIDFIRWFPGALPVGTPIPAYIFTPAPYLDYEFSSGNIGFDTSSSSQNLAGLSYVDPPVSKPVCNAGVSQTIAVGGSMTLDGSGSYALDGHPNLFYNWSYLGKGADGISQAPGYSNNSAVNPVVTGLQFGSFNSQLQVTDSSGNSSVCAVHNGAVIVSNRNGAINLTAEGVTSVQQTIIGPQVAFGRNTWPWADVAITNELNLQTKQLQPGALYDPYWRTLQPGSITLSAGSSIVTGNGTHFVALFCSPGGVAGGTSDGSFLTWQYPGTDGLTHYGQFRVVSCVDDTHLVISSSFIGAPSPFAYPAAPNAPWPVCTTPCSGLGFGRTDTSGGSAFSNWYYSPAPANYYDNVMFFLVNYWRSGIDTFYAGAQNMATYWMEWPVLDYYYNCNVQMNNYNPGGGTLCPGENREISLTGMALWEQQPGNGYLLPALENVGQRYTSYAGTLPTFVGLNDMREDAYAFAGLATLTLIETNPATKANYQSVIKNSLDRLWTPYLRTQPFVGWNQFYFGFPNSVANAGGSGSVDLSPGSTTIVGHGTVFDTSLLGNTIWTFPAPAGTLPAYCGNCSTTGSVVGGDSHSYVITAVDSVRQILTISEPYAGATNLTGRGFATGGTSGIPGWGFQPYALGLLGAAFFMDAQAMNGYDAGAQSTFQNYGHLAANSLAGMVSDQGGFDNGVYFPGCAPPIFKTATQAQLYCYGAEVFYQGPVWSPGTVFNAGDYAVFNGLQYQSLQAGNINNLPLSSGGSWWRLVSLVVSPVDPRQTAIETMRAFSFDFQTFGTSAATANLLMSNMFSKPGTGGPNPDGYYLSSYDLATTPPGWYVFALPQGSGGDPSAKWAGQLAGFAQGAVTWPGVLATLP